MKSRVDLPSVMVGNNAVARHIRNLAKINVDALASERVFAVEFTWAVFEIETNQAILPQLILPPPLLYWIFSHFSIVGHLRESLAHAAVAIILSGVI
jgi:hypothetical protein